jgi:pimeloyl-ACP methyl ester carboxylesterase
MPERFQVNIGRERLIGVLNKVENNSKSCIISCHGMLASKDSPKYVLLSEKLSELGYTTVRFDFRGCGESDGQIWNSHLSNRLADLEAIVEHVRSEFDIDHFGLFGSSMGGYISYLKAAKDLRIKTMVTLASPFSMAELFNLRALGTNGFEIDGVFFGNDFLKDIRHNGNLDPDALGGLKCPTLIFHGDADILVPVSHAKRLYDSLKTEKSLRIIPGGDHVFSHPMHLDEIIKTSTEWFVKYLHR